MGSFQQISVGVVCLAAAFILGRYLNNYPNPETIETGFQHPTSILPVGSETSVIEPGKKINRPAPMETMRGQASNYPTMKLAERTGFQPEKTDLPPPSQLAFEDNQAPPVPAKMPNLQQKSTERKVVVPDFSQLASQLQKTPLELGPLEATPHALAPMQALTPAPASGIGSNQFVIGNDQAGSIPPVTNPAAGPVYELQPVQNGFTSDDFVPQLKNSADSNRSIQHENNRVVSLQAPSNSFNNSNPIQVSQHNPPPNLATVTQQQAIERASDSMRVAKPVIPFGLTQEAKTELVELRRQRDARIELGASRFKEHVTAAGETLQGLSTRYYGRPDFYLDIYIANPETLRNPATVPAGIRLRIPLYD